MNNVQTSEQSRVTRTVSGLYATDKTPMYVMPVIYAFGILGFGVRGEHFLYWGFRQWHFVIEVLSRDRVTKNEKLSCFETNFTRP